jgi:hypothetical protein
MLNFFNHTEMQDGNDHVKFLHFGFRGALSTGHPALHVNYGSLPNMIHLDERGLATFYLPDETDKKIRAAIPDCDGLSDAELESMPEYVRNFKCSGVIEGGDPYCGTSKWSSYPCPDRYKQTNWHPGL